MAHYRQPFGMLFEEQAPLPAVEPCPPQYDEVAGLSFVLTSDGQRIPYVQYALNAEQTQSLTFVATEVTDVDTRPRPTTATHTKVQAETTDKD